MEVKVTKQAKNQLKLDIVIPNSDVKKVYNKELDKVVKEADIKGFRKGQAPKNIVEEKVDKNKLYSEVINSLLQTYYPQALKENKIQPIANPKVDLQNFDIEKDLEFTAYVAIKPEVKIGDYKKEILNLYKQKQDQLKKENAEKLKKGEKIEVDHLHLTPDDVVQGVVNVSEIEIPDLAIEEETNRIMSKFLDQLQSVGMNIDDYLKSINKTAQEVRQSYTGLAIKNLTAELALEKLVEDLKIEVTEKDVDDMILATGQKLEDSPLNSTFQRSYIKVILRKNKVINQILNELDDQHDHNDDGTIKETAETPKKKPRTKKNKSSKKE